MPKKNPRLEIVSPDRVEPSSDSPGSPLFELRAGVQNLAGLAEQGFTEVMALADCIKQALSEPTIRVEHVRTLVELVDLRADSILDTIEGEAERLKPL